MTTTETKSGIPDYFTPELFARDVEVTQEWRRFQERKNSTNVCTYVETVIRDSGTWIPVKLFDLKDAWLLLWNRDKNQLRVPKVIGQEGGTATDLSVCLTSYVLPEMNPYVSDSLYTQGATIVAFCLYLHKHASDIHVIAHVPRFVNVEPFRLKIIKNEEL